MSASLDLQQLAARQEAAPFGFEEFERRQVQRQRQRRATALGVAGTLAGLGLVSLLAVLTQSGPRGLAGPAAMLVEPGHELPALVDLGQFELTSQIEDQIALLDDQLSAARVLTAPPERLRELESTREQLTDSLQRVSYAHTLLSL